MIIHDDTYHLIVNFNDQKQILLMSSETKNDVPTKSLNTRLLFKENFIVEAWLMHAFYLSNSVCKIIMEQFSILAHYFLEKELSL